MQSKDLNLRYNHYNNTEISNNIKIFVSYIKPSFLFESDILIPVHLGRAVSLESSKDGIISDEELEWLYGNCIGDDDFEGNISRHNRRVGFFTGTYWAFKNYEKLDNPKYFGSFGYRKLLTPVFLDKLENYDVILPKKTDFKIETLKEQCINYHGEDVYLQTISIIKSIYPDEVENIELYFSGTCGYFHELYIMKKELFFNFCNWMLPILYELLKTSPIKIRQDDTRDIGFIIERLTGYYLTKLTLDYQTKEVDIIMTQKPFVNKENINKALLARLRKKV